MGYLIGRDFFVGLSDKSSVLTPTIYSYLYLHLSWNYHPALNINDKHARPGEETDRGTPIVTASMCMWGERKKVIYMLADNTDRLSEVETASRKSWMMVSWLVYIYTHSFLVGLDGCSRIAPRCMGRFSDVEWNTTWSDNDFSLVWHLVSSPTKCLLTRSFRLYNDDVHAWSTATWYLHACIFMFCMWS